MSDERQGFPSASSATRLINCPGSHNAETAAALTLRGDDSPESVEGTFLHSVMSGDRSEIGLSDMHEYLVNTANRLADTARELSGAKREVRIIEERMWVHDPETGKPLISGQIDLAEGPIESGPGWTNDWKFGWNGAGQAEDNDQLRWYSALLYSNRGWYPISASLIQPRLPKESQLTRVEFDKTDLEQAELEMIRVGRAALRPDAPRKSGPWCKLCKARGLCQEAKEEALSLGTIEVSGDGSKAIQSPVTARELDLYDVAEKVIEERRRMALEQLRNAPDSIPGWRVPEPRCTAKITNSAQAAQRLIEAFPTIGPRLSEAAKFSIPQIVKLVRAISPGQFKNELAAREFVNGVLGDSVETESSEVSKPVKIR